MSSKQTKQKIIAFSFMLTIPILGLLFLGTNLQTQTVFAACGGITSVGNEDELNTAISTFNAANSPPCIFTIQLDNDINLTGATISATNSIAGIHLVIDGQEFTIDGQNNTGGQSILTLDLEGNATVQNITLTGGNETNGNGGGAIFSATSLTLTNSSLISNTSTEDGGALNIETDVYTNEVGIVTIFNTIFDDNASGFYGGAINIDMDGANPSTGAAITITMDTVTMTNNIAETNNDEDSHGGALNIDADLGGDSVSVTTSLKNMFFANNRSDHGGAIYFDNQADADNGTINTYLDNLIFNGNQVDFQGGAIYFNNDANDPYGTINTYLDNLTLTGNRSDTNGGAIYFDNDANDPNSTVDTYLDNLVLTDNRADHGGGAIYFDNDANAHTSTINTVIENLIVSGNEANTYRGGGIYFDNDGNEPNSTITTLIDNTIITDNMSITYLGGGIGFDNDAYDPGVVVTTTLQNSTIANNRTSTSKGGGIFVDGNASSLGSRYTLYIINTSITGNTAYTGGGIDLKSTADEADGASVQVIIDRSLIANNTANVAGGIYHEGDETLTVVNSTLSGNRSLASSGGGYFQTSKQDNPPLETYFINSTIVFNEASVSGGGISLGITETVSISNTVVANNTAPVDADLNNGVNSGFDIVYSLIGDVGNSDFNDHGDNQLGGNGNPVIDPLLEPLADNGGPTETHALQVDSPAINSGNDAICAASPVNGVDQRGLPRDVIGACDMGAFELVNISFMPIIMK